jgi:hypothetical protein
MNRRFVALGLLALVAIPGCALDFGADGKGKAEGALQGGYAPPKRKAPPAMGSHCSPAPALLPQAVCVCGDLAHAGALSTEARPGGAADVGVERNASFAAGTSVDGSLRVGEGLSFAGAAKVRDHLWASRGISFAGNLDVGGDLATGGGFHGAGAADVGGQLRVQDDVSVAGTLRSGGRAPYAEPSEPPCGCDAARLYDVKAAVDLARTKNDNGRAGISPDGALATANATELALPSGRYYVRDLESVGALKVRAKGSVQLYVEGSLVQVGAARFAIDPGATLDLFVAGSVTSVGALDLGDAERPEAFRLYVGGEGGTVSLVGAARFSGLVYAPRATVSLAGGAVVDGALFAGDLSFAGAVKVRHAAVGTQGTECEEPMDPPASQDGGTPSQDGGTPAQDGGGTPAQDGGAPAQDSGLPSCK